LKKFLLMRKICEVRQLEPRLQKMAFELTIYSNNQVT